MEFPVNDPEDRDMGASRLLTRLKAFKDEHIKVEIVPLMFGIADIWADDLNSEIIMASKVLDINDFPIRYVALHGTIFTKFDKKMANELDDITDFEQLQGQSEKIFDRMMELKPTIQENLTKFIPMKEMELTEDHKVG